jgi:hypothetical protein
MGPSCHGTRISMPPAFSFRLKRFDRYFRNCRSLEVVMSVFGIAEQENGESV